MASGFTRIQLLERHERESNNRQSCRGPDDSRRGASVLGSAVLKSFDPDAQEFATGIGDSSLSPQCLAPLSGSARVHRVPDGPGFRGRSSSSGQVEHAHQVGRDCLDRPGSNIAYRRLRMPHLSDPTARSDPKLTIADALERVPSWHVRARRSENIVRDSAITPEPSRRRSRMARPSRCGGPRVRSRVPHRDGRRN